MRTCPPLFTLPSPLSSNLIFSPGFLSLSLLYSYVLRFVERITFDIKLHAAFFQLPYLVTFDAILQDASVKSDPAFHKLRAFAKLITQRFFETLATNKMLSVLALFHLSRAQLEDVQDPGGRARTTADRAAARETARQESLRKQLAARLGRSANLSLAHQQHQLEEDASDGDEAELGPAGVGVAPTTRDGGPDAVSGGGDAAHDPLRARLLALAQRRKPVMEEGEGEGAAAADGEDAGAEGAVPQVC